MQSKAKQIPAKQSKAGLGGGSPPTRGVWGAGVPPGSETQFFVWPKAWYVCNLYRCFCSLAMSATSQQPWSRDLVSNSVSSAVLVLAMVHCMRSAHFLLLRQPLQQTETEALEQFEIITRPAYRAPVSCVLLVQQF